MGRRRSAFSVRLGRGTNAVTSWPLNQLAGLALWGGPSTVRGIALDIGAKVAVGRLPAVEACIHGGAHEVAIRKGLPPAFPSGVAGNLETGQDGHEMHVHIGVKQPHGRSR